MLQEEIQPSVYFAQEDPELLQIYDHIGKATTSDQAGSAVEGLVLVLGNVLVTSSIYQLQGKSSANIRFSNLLYFSLV